MILYERIECVNEAVGKDILAYLFASAVTGGLVAGTIFTVKYVGKLFDRLLGIKKLPPPKTKDDADELKPKINKALVVLRKIEEMASSSPKMVYASDYNIYSYIKIGVYDTTSLTKYINRFKKDLVKVSTVELRSIYDDAEDEESYNYLKNSNALYIISDGFGNSTWWINGKVVDWDHESHTITEGAYEDVILREIDYIYRCMSDDGLLKESKTL